MKYHQQDEKQFHKNSGMTLVEVLVSMVILSIAIVTFLPLGQSSYENIVKAGQKLKQTYMSISLMEKLIGNDGANGFYETRTDDVPLEFHAYKPDGTKDSTVQSLKAGKEEKNASMQSINGSSLLSTPEKVAQGYSTFICDSVTTSMVAFPTHIADDFIKKRITLYAVGFRFANNAPFKLYYTDEDGTKKLIPNERQYYSVSIEKKNSSIAYLTLCGDNDLISFTHSPLYITYNDDESKEIRIELDAPTVIMVGGKAEDGNYYYYVTSGEPILDDGTPDEENGTVRIVRKKMKNTGPISKDPISLSATMNNVVWVDAGEGDGKEGSNAYGYYVMCGEHGQIRRFWKNPKTGNYGWDGDNVIQYDNFNGKETKDSKFTTTTDFSYSFSHGNYLKPVQNMCLLPKPIDNKKPIFDRLYTNVLFTVNAPKKHPEGIDFYVAGNQLYAEARNSTANGSNCFITSPTSSGYNKTAMENHKIIDGTMLQHITATEAMSYKDFYDLNHPIDNPISLTSVVPVNFSTKGTGATGERYPQQSYMLYCGTIPAVMDIWTTDELIKYNSTGDRITPWRATLGVAYRDRAEQTGSPYYKSIGNIWNEKHYGHVWSYGDTTAANYALSGVCGPINYDYEQYECDKCHREWDESELNSGDTCPVCGVKVKKSKKADCLWNSITAADLGGILDTPEKRIFPLNLNFHQDYMQTQNETDITVSYLSHPYALSDVRIDRCHRDMSPNRTDDFSGVFEWGLNNSVTIFDADTINYPDEEGNDRYFSLAVGYYVAGIAYEDWYNGGSTGLSYHNVSVPTVMNNGIVLMRSGFETDYPGDTTAVANQMAQMKTESNIFRPFFTTNDYTVRTQADHDNATLVEVRKNTFDRNVSAGYWRDVYHPYFCSVHGEGYDPTKSRKKYNYIMGHILQNKQLNCVCWGETWAGRPEAMWGASDGTMMSWYLDTNDNKDRGNDVDAEFQSYLRLKYAKHYHDLYDKACGGEWKFEQVYCKNFDDGILSRDSKSFTLPSSLIGAKGIIQALQTDDSGWKKADDADASVADRTKNPKYNNTYLDKCSLQLACKDASGTDQKTVQNEQILKDYGFISPLQTIEDLEYANDTWVGVGKWGLSNPIHEDGITYCGKKAVLHNGVGDPEGSWVCVRTWLPQKEDHTGPQSGDCNYIWQAVQISKEKHCNIEQISYSNGMWYAMGYREDKDGDHAVMFYARDPQKPCDGKNKDGGWDGGWRLCKNGKESYTTAYKNDGKGGFSEPLEIEGINSVASRND